MKLNMLAGLVVDGVPPVSRRERIGLVMALWSTMPFGLIPVIFMASVNNSVRTPELALKEKDISSGLVMSD